VLKQTFGLSLPKDETVQLSGLSFPKDETAGCLNERTYGQSLPKGETYCLLLRPFVVQTAHVFPTLAGHGLFFDSHAGDRSLLHSRAFFQVAASLGKNIRCRLLWRLPGDHQMALLPNY
jgi:hypothetical protein